MNDKNTPKPNENPDDVVFASFAAGLERDNSLLRSANADVRRIAMERDRLESALKILLRRHEEEITGGEPISGEEWEIASYALPSRNVERSREG